MLRDSNTWSKEGYEHQGRINRNTVPGYLDWLEGEDDQQYHSELLSMRPIDLKRAAIAKRARQAGKNERKGRCRTGSAKDLLADLKG